MLPIPHSVATNVFVRAVAIYVFGFLFFLLMCSMAPAATLYWDTSAGAGNGVGGSATWGTSFSSSATGSASLSTAATGDTLNFQGTAGTITLGANQTAAAININVTGYKLTANSATTRSLTGPVTLADNVNFTLGNGETTNINLTLASNLIAGTGAGLTLNGAATGSNMTRLNVSGTGTTISAPITVTGSGFAALVGNSGSSIISGAVTGSGQRLNIGATSGNTLTLSDTINNGSGTVRIAAGSSGGAGTVVFSGSGNTWGDTELNNAASGVVRLGVNNALPTSTKLVFGATATNGDSTLDLRGFSQTIGQLTNGAQAGGIITNGVASTTSTLTISGSDTTASAFSGVIQNGSGTVEVERSGTGKTVLTGTNTYTGSTILGGGNLQVGQGSVGKTGTGAVTVNGSGAVLSGTGTVDGVSTSVILGTIKPGDNGGASTGSLNTKTLIFTPVSATTVAELQIASASNFDWINVTGDLTLNALSNILVDGTGYSATIGDSFTLIDWSGVLTTGGFSTGANLRSGADSAMNEGNLNLPDISAVGLWEITAFSGSGALKVSVVAVPEPSRMVLMLLGVMGLMSRRRRR
jgi:fibronectin-binding autotransporter adhesin